MSFILAFGKREFRAGDKGLQVESQFNEALLKQGTIAEET